MKPTNIKALQAQSRHLRARLVDKHTVVVESASNPRANHVVTVRFGADGRVYARCTCPWALHNGIACTHVMAALEYLASLKDRTLSFWPTHADALRQKHRVFYLSDGSGEGEEGGVWITSRADYDEDDDTPRAG